MSLFGFLEATIAFLYGSGATGASTLSQVEEARLAHTDCERKVEETILAHTVETVELELEVATFGERNTLGGSARLPLPEKFSGKMDDWEDWLYSVKNYVALFKTDILEVMERSERSERAITDQDVAGLMTDPDDV